jgi:tellurite resistance protein TehA-like permease
MNTWATENWQRWYLGWLLTHPSSTIQVMNSQMVHSLAPTVWGDVVAATPSSVGALFLGTPSLPQDVFPKKSYHVQPLILWGLAALFLAFTVRRLGRWRGSPWAVDIALAASVAGGLLCAISSGLLIQTMPFEVAQESLASTVIITAALVAAVGLGLDRVLSPGSRAVGGAADGLPGTGPPG